MAQTQAKGDVFKHRQMREQGVRLEHQAHFTLVGAFGGDVFTIEHNAPGLRCEQPGNRPHRGCFAAARGPQKRQQFALGHWQIERIDGHLAAISKGQVFQRQVGFQGINRQIRSDVKHSVKAPKGVRPPARSPSTSAPSGLTVRQWRGHKQTPSTPTCRSARW